MRIFYNKSYSFYNIRRAKMQTPNKTNANASLDRNVSLYNALTMTPTQIEKTTKKCILRKWQVCFQSCQPDLQSDERRADDY